jgi:nickel-dependent lactate racemase
MRPMRTGRWYGDEAFTLAWPDEWSVSVRWPDTPLPLTTDQVAAALQNPVGLGTVAEISRGKRKPLLIVDDLSRPTPVALIIEPILRELAASGIEAGQVTILLATGTHPAPSVDGVREKIGPKAAGACRAIVHVDTQNCTRIGRTRFGTPIFVDRSESVV